MESKQLPIINLYNVQINSINDKITDYKKRLNYLSFARLISFLLAIAGIYALGEINLLYGIGAGVFFTILFFYFVLTYIKNQQVLFYTENLKKVLENEVRSISEKGNMYPDGGQFADAQHPYSDDLDIFGDKSVFHYINRCATLFGNTTLSDWLKDLPAEQTIKARQEAIIELTKHIGQAEWVRAILLPLNNNNLNNITNAVQNQFKKLLAFTSAKWLKYYASITPYLLPALLLLVFLTEASWQIILPVMGLNYLINAFYGKNINQVHELIGKSSDKVQVYATVLQWIESEKWNSNYLNNLQQQCKSQADGKLAYQQIEKLAKLVKLLDYRLNIVVGVLLNVGFLWDIRCAFKIKKWHKNSSEAVIKGLEIIGEFEALISLSTLTYNQPEWIFPQIEKGFVFAAQEMGHPLIPKAHRIYNNFSYADGKTVDVITGSNMSGKSTFLRTIGVNMVLGFTGAPVCCKELMLSPIKLISYMRIKDSLNENTSTFKAEIDRLKMILEISSSTGNSFALIDEMLRGTNSKDKYLGTKAFIEKLIEQNSAAIIATHDLQVAELEQKYLKQLRNYHFDIQTDGTDMFFDYKLKNGKCETFNASILLKKIGLKPEESEFHS